MNYKKVILFGAGSLLNIAINVLHKKGIEIVLYIYVITIN